MVKAEVPVLVSINVCEPALEPKSLLLGERLHGGHVGQEPLDKPKSGRVKGPFAASLAMNSVALSLPAWWGVKVMLRPQIS